MSLLSNLSYTNKDFNTIYSELLDLVDKISPVWKPGSANGSNESDPGVLLLKLDALMADKNNYNIDKNVLELYPDSVTQYANAREIYEQCGYIMPYYRAAECKVTLALIKELDKASTEQINTYTLPTFTELVNEDATIKYTLIDPKVQLDSASKTADFTALQGTHVIYDINGRQTITYADLDYNNRIYFKESNIAENGIFIFNIDNNAVNYHTGSNWKKVDNLLLEAQKTLCYKFNVSREGNQCYLEFPPDIANLIGDGIEIHYLLTDGAKGNINKNVLKKFFTDNVKIKLNDVDNGDEINTDNIYINNYLPSQDGADPEDLITARKNYERTKNTFKTLVSLSDYNNFVLNSDEVSNGFVCDRTNDIQSTVKIQTLTESLSTLYNQVLETDDGKPQLSPFDLKIYALSKTPSLMSYDDFDKGFRITDTYFLQEDLKEYKCIQHNFTELLEDKIINIQLNYSLSIQVIPFNKIDLEAEKKIKKNITTALMQTLKAENMTYGEEVDYDLVYDTIKNADNRIKAIILDDIEYTPMAVTGSGSRLLEDADENEIKAKCVLKGLTPLYERSDNFIYTAIDSPYSSGYHTVSTITTNTNLTLEPSSNIASVTLEENENLYLTCPNYITKESYSTYVKYFYKFREGITVNKDDVYAMKSPDEYIVFLWKDEDSTTAPYKYQKYVGNSENPTLISPTFSLGNATDYQQLPESYRNSAKTLIESLQSSSSELTAEESALIAKCDTGVILSGNQQIHIKDKNNLTFEGSDYNLYWVLNKQEDNKYTIKFENNEYILNSGEYLFYAPQDHSFFALLGAGTKLKIDKIDPNDLNSLIPKSISVRAKSYEEVLYGKDSLLSDEGLWDNLDSGLKLTATEMKFYNLGPGTTVTFSGVDVGVTITINNSGMYQGENPYKPTSISYSLDGRTTTLPTITDTEGWTGRSILNLKMSTGKPQKLVHNTDDTDANKYTRTQSLSYGASTIITPNTDNPTIYVQSAYALDMLGGKDVDISAINLLGDKFDNKLFVSTRTTGNLNNNILTQDISLTGNSGRIDIKTPALKANNTGLLIPIELVADPESEITFNYGSNELTPINSKESTLLNRGIYIFKATTNSEIPNTINLGGSSGSSGSIQIKIHPIIKYNFDNSIDPLSTSNLVYNTLRTLDKSYRFNYLYEVPENDLIQKPEIGKSFLEKEHPYNIATICKWNHRDSSIRIINKAR